MMGEIAFSNNYNDISDETGFQFEFYCEACGDVWRAEYKRYLAGTTSGIVKTVGSLLGGLLGGAERVADQVSDAGYRGAHDKAFAEAVEQAKVHFQRCRRCGNYFCSKCYNPNLKLCTNCAPSVEEESNVAARQAEIEMATEKAASAVKSGKRQTDGNVVCESCGARVKPGKFCSECGGTMSTKLHCRSCNAELEGSPKFCPECGQKL
jgi:membrane protease subunit (stomatin/prohibitin family)